MSDERHVVFQGERSHGAHDALGRDARLPRRLNRCLVGKAAHPDALTKAGLCAVGGDVLRARGEQDVSGKAGQQFGGMRRRLRPNPIANGLPLAHNAQVLASLRQGCRAGIRGDNACVGVRAVNHHIKRALRHEVFHAHLVQTLCQDASVGERP